MRGITEGSILASIKDDRAKGKTLEILQALLIECTELNPWKPIDNAPKDRRILIFDEVHGVIIGQWFDGNWVSSMVMMHNVTHYQELPQPPKEEKNDTPRTQII